MSDIRWFGWLRVRGEWQRLVEAESIGAAARKLSALTEGMRPRPPNSDECLTTGAVPDLRRREN